MLCTIHDLRTADDGKSGLFTTPGTHVSSRIYPVMLGAFFVASCRVGAGRCYYVHFCADGGKVSGPFGAAAIRDNQAHTYARELARAYGWSNVTGNPACTRCGYVHERANPQHMMPDGGTKCAGNLPVLLFCIGCGKLTGYEREATLPEEYRCGDPDYEDKSKCGVCGETYQCPVCGAPWGRRARLLRGHPQRWAGSSRSNSLITGVDTPGLIP